MFEQAAGELHAKLMIDSHNWATYSNRGPSRGAGGRWRGLAGNTQTISTARLEAAARPAGPGRASRRRAERSSQRGRRAGGQATRRPETRRRPEHQRRHKLRGRLAGGPLPTGTHSGQAHRAERAAAGHAKGAGTEVPAPHSATASSRLRPNGCQSWRRRRIHRNMPPTTAAPRPAPPIRPSKPVRARPFFGLVAGTSGAT